MKMKIIIIVNKLNKKLFKNNNKNKVIKQKNG